MPAVLKIALAVLLSALACAPAASASASSGATGMRHAYVDWKSGFRHNDGEQACGRMTLGYRKSVLARFIKAVPTLAGMGCVAIVNIYGRDIYVGDLRDETAKLDGLRMHGKCADWRAHDGSGRRAHGVKQEGRWKLAGSGAC